MATTDSGHNDTSVQSQPPFGDQAMRAARSDPGGGEIPMKATKPFVVCPERKAIVPVRGVVDKCDKAKRLKEIIPTGLGKSDRSVLLKNFSFTLWN